MIIIRDKNNKKEMVVDYFKMSLFEFTKNNNQEEDYMTLIVENTKISLFKNQLSINLN